MKLILYLDFILEGKIYLQSKVASWQKIKKVSSLPSLIFTNAKDSLGKLISKLKSFSVSKFCFNKSRNHQTQKGFHKDDPVYSVSAVVGGRMHL